MKCFLDTSIQKSFFQIIQITNFRVDLTDNSVKKEKLKEQKLFAGAGSTRPSGTWLMRLLLAQCWIFCHLEAISWLLMSCNFFCSPLQLALQNAKKIRVSRDFETFARNMQKRSHSGLAKNPVSERNYWRILLEFGNFFCHKRYRRGGFAKTRFPNEVVFFMDCSFTSYNALSFFGFFCLVCNQRFFSGRNSA